MTRPPHLLVPVAAVALTLVLVSCAPSHETSLRASYQEYLGLTSGGYSDTAIGDLKAAAPKWHEAVAEPVLTITAGFEDLDGTGAFTASQQKSVGSMGRSQDRLKELCGTQLQPKY